MLRPARADDLAALADLKRATFVETFGPTGFAIPYPAADLAAFLADAYGHARIAAEIADPAHGTWVVEDSDGALIAYAHVGPCKLPHADVREGDGELYQIYVLRRAQGLGLGRRLMDAAMAFLTAQGGAIWIGVWSQNLPAQRFYAAYGFDRVGEYQFVVGDCRDDEFILRRG
ncbi:GNAT family N-acetyltransferase [Novosphingobium sp. FSY-8]|uniref:GNAT family N-acetyltransferase n=1 Tax=Novosphingobium ovatum TaxID=1908523 RepID=A0ABW9XAB6_9SPHN|nr:GNAT family N-acetyltransferase [Novosphingobium ovatum]